MQEQMHFAFDSLHQTQQLCLCFGLGRGCPAVVPKCAYVQSYFSQSKQPCHSAAVNRQHPEVFRKVAGITAMSGPNDVVPQDQTGGNLQSEHTAKLKQQHLFVLGPAMSIALVFESRLRCDSCRRQGISGKPTGPSIQVPLHLC